MAEEFIFRSGKYVGKTLHWVKENNPTYISWLKENRPEMLKEKVAKPIEKNTSEEKRKNTPLQPNTDFLNQKNEKKI